MDVLRRIHAIVLTASAGSHNQCMVAECVTRQANRDCEEFGGVVGLWSGGLLAVYSCTVGMLVDKESLKTSL